MTTPTLEEISATLENHLVFVVLAETLDAWQPPSTPEGRGALHAHYLWAREALAQGRLLFAGPLNLGARRGRRGASGRCVPALRGGP